MPARRLLYLAALACLLAVLPLTCRLVPAVLDALAPAPAPGPFPEEMGALNRDYSRAVGAAPDEATRDELRRLRVERAREVYRRHGRRWPDIVAFPVSETPPVEDTAAGR
jgi:hypothetical protein